MKNFLMPAAALDAVAVMLVCDSGFTLCAFDFISAESIAFSISARTVALMSSSSIPAPESLHQLNQNEVNSPLEVLPGVTLSGPWVAVFHIMYPRLLFGFLDGPLNGTNSASPFLACSSIVLPDSMTSALL